MKRSMRVVGEILVAALLLLAVNEAWVRSRPGVEPGEIMVPGVLIIEVNRPKSWRL
jgi:hypothetical protein